MDNYQLFLLQFGKLKIRLVLKQSFFRPLNNMKESVTTTILLDHISWNGLSNKQKKNPGSKIFPTEKGPQWFWQMIHLFTVSGFLLYQFQQIFTSFLKQQVMLGTGGQEIKFHEIKIGGQKILQS